MINKRAGVLFLCFALTQCSEGIDLMDRPLHKNNASFQNEEHRLLLMDGAQDIGSANESIPVSYSGEKFDIANDTSKELAKASLSTLTTHGACSNLYSSGSAASLSLPLETLKLFFQSLQLMYLGHDERVLASCYDHLTPARDAKTSKKRNM